MNEVLPGVDEAVGALGIDLGVVVTLTDPEGLGAWIAEQVPDTQAAILSGFLLGLGEPPADVMVRMVQVGQALHAGAPAAITYVTSALEHLLRGVRELGLKRGA